MNLLDVPVKHFILSKMRSFGIYYNQTNKPDTIYYTYKKLMIYMKVIKLVYGNLEKMLMKFILSEN